MHWFQSVGTVGPTHRFTMRTRWRLSWVTPQEMRQFAAECRRWPEQTDNTSHRELMIRTAKSWMAIAATLEWRLSADDELALPDLRSELD